MQKTYKPTLLIDLDGVLNEYKGNYDVEYIPEMREGAQDFLKELYQNYTLVLFTTRFISMARKWLENNGLDKYFDDVTNEKIPAYIMIDDRCICFKGDYEVLKNEIKNFRAWHK